MDVCLSLNLSYDHGSIQIEYAHLFSNIVHLLTTYMRLPNKIHITKKHTHTHTCNKCPKKPHRNDICNDCCCLVSIVCHWDPKRLFSSLLNVS